MSVQVCAPSDPFAREATWLDGSAVDIGEWLDEVVSVFLVDSFAEEDDEYDILIQKMRATAGLPPGYDHVFVVGTLQEIMEPTQRVGFDASLVIRAIECNPGASLSELYSTVGGLLEPEEFASDVRYLASLGLFKLVSPYGVEWKQIGDEALEDELSIEFYSDEVFIELLEDYM